MLKQLKKEQGLFWGFLETSEIILGPYSYIDGFCNSWYQDFFFVFIIVFVQALNLKECKKKKKVILLFEPSSVVFEGKQLFFLFKTGVLKTLSTWPTQNISQWVYFWKNLQSMAQGEAKNYPAWGCVGWATQNLVELGGGTVYYFCFLHVALIFNLPQNRLPICFFIPCSSPNADFFFFQIFNF